MARRCWGFAKAVAQIYSEQWGIPVNIVEGDTEINPDVGKIVAERFVIRGHYRRGWSASSQVCSPRSRSLKRPDWPT
ncbi:MAG: hypothetical protein R2911_42390 [Caldilineaceae bacterium]